jgi:hypothetical protein
MVERLGNDAPPSGFVWDAYRPFVLERLRGAGLHAVGGEDAVFGRDESRSAEFMLGGVVREFRCKRLQSGLNCGMGMHWQVLDVRSDRVIRSKVSIPRAMSVAVKRRGPLRRQRYRWLPQRPAIVTAPWRSNANGSNHSAKSSRRTTTAGQRSAIRQPTTFQCSD